MVKKELKCLKPIRHVETDSRGGFRFITYDDYDTAMYIHHSETDDKVIQVKRNIEPNVLRIFDIKDKKVLSLYDE